MEIHIIHNLIHYDLEIFWVLHGNNDIIMTADMTKMKHNAMERNIGHFD